MLFRSYLMQKALFNMAGVRSDTVTQTNTNEGFANVIAGTTDVVFGALNASALDYVKEGTITPIAAFSEDVYPFGDIEVPSVKSLGYDLAFSSFGYLAIRSGTDEAVVEYINKAINSVYADPEFKEEAAKLEIFPTVMSSEQVDKYMDENVENIKNYFEISNKQ